MVDERKLNVAVVGVGGCGSNILASIYNDFKDNDTLGDLSWAAINTDAQALKDLVDNKGMPEECVIQVGEKATNGLGAGSKPEVGESAAKEDLDVIRNLVSDKDLVVVVAGLGGGSGSGITPVLLSEAKKAEALTLCWLIMPSDFEGPKRNSIAKSAVKSIHEEADSYVIISNDASNSVTFDDSISEINNTVSRGTRIMLEVLVTHSRINVDFADFRTIIRSGGRTLFSIASFDGDKRDTKVAKELLRFAMQPGTRPKNVKNAMVFIKGGKDLRNDEIKHISSSVKDKLSEKALIIMGVSTTKEKHSLDAVVLGSTGK